MRSCLHACSFRRNAQRFSAADRSCSLPETPEGPLCLNQCLTAFVPAERPYASHHQGGTKLLAIEWTVAYAGVRNKALGTVLEEMKKDSLRPQAFNDQTKPLSESALWEDTRP